MMKKKILEGAGMFFLAIGSCEQLIMFALIGFYLLYRAAKGEEYLRKGRVPFGARFV